MSIILSSSQQESITRDTARIKDENKIFNMAKPSYEFSSDCIWVGLLWRGAIKKLKMHLPLTTKPLLCIVAFSKRAWTFLISTNKILRHARATVLQPYKTKRSCGYLKHKYVYLKRREEVLSSSAGSLIIIDLLLAQ